MNEMKVFESKEFGQVRVIEHDGKAMFCGSDVAKALGYARPNEAVSYHAKGTQKFRTLTNGGEQELLYVTEGDVYRLITHSKLPSAEKFESWVFEEVLPSIRKTLTVLESVKYSGDVNGVVYAKDGIPTTTSSSIAEVFGRNHRDILRLIDNKLSDSQCAQFCADHIHTIDTIDSRGRAQRQYELDEQGFSFIALGLTGAKADQFKIEYIEMFAKMKEALANMFKARLIESVLPQDNRSRQFIYVLKNPLNDTVKIGVAQDVQKRIQQLQTGAGVELELVYQSMVCSNAFSIERDVHSHFEKYRTFGEWFKVSPDEVIDFLEKQSFVLKSEFAKYVSLMPMMRGE